MHIRRSNERKFFDHRWLKTYHTFSFASYYDPAHMGFRSLRVINEDRVMPGHGFPEHDHNDMEIISIVLEGELAHRDSMGHETILHTNEVQAMTAGQGIVHSEYNPSKTNWVHFLQIWIYPEQKNLKPKYQNAMLPTKQNEWVLIASKNSKTSALKIEQDVELYALSLDAGQAIDKKIPKNHYGWLQMIDGEIQLNQESVRTGDGVAISAELNIKIAAVTPSRMLFFVLN